VKRNVAQITIMAMKWSAITSPGRTITTSDTPAVVNAIDANISDNARIKFLVASPTKLIITNNAPLEMSERLKQKTKMRLNNGCIRIPITVDLVDAFIAVNIFFGSTMYKI